ncbi:death domain-associated protein 6-like [Myripristis murdjan]|uniref:Death domain-associated protein 6 n=1 Tax=Myripristis murdjan TaxID=586833 RepID=A0A667XV11_9TELE|nr:death domain-associated protein 6-like [Myripristis murdjan]XP_029919935.1 death domain-associated protein 6-like [Myripristis murdjan]XP_029919936.1 death domain-associated protein 6-like [Myripristis murdjan]
MAVATASMAESIIILDDDEEESPQPSCSTAASSSRRPTTHTSPLRARQPAPTHITQSPFASAKKDSHVLQAENQKLFTEFVQHCSSVTQDCPEVLTFLQAKHTKASPEFLSSVEFRNTLGRCLTRAQANRSKIFVYINELCTVLRQHAVKRRLPLTKAEPGPPTSASVSSPSTSVSLKSKDKTKVHAVAEEEEVKKEGMNTGEDDEPSTSGLQEDREDKNGQEQEETEKKKRRASRRQIAYLENLLKVYDDEIRRLQESELSLNDLGAEDSGYIQEHKLKRKMMKIYDKLCDLKGCSTLTGRVIEHRISYTSTRYPEINKKIERFINSPEAQRNPPDYQDILQLVLRANERYNLCLSRKQMNQIAQEAFRETGSSLQQRRHLDLVYNFGSHITDEYKPASDPALTDATLLRKLRDNRETALSNLEEVITRYAVRQDDIEEQERNRRLERDRLERESHVSEEGEERTEVVNGVAEEEQEEEEEDDEDDESSDPDIEEEIQASIQQIGPDDNEEEEDDSNEAQQANDNISKEEQGAELSGNVSPEEQGSDNVPVTSRFSPVSSEDKPGISPLSDSPSPRDSPSQSEPLQSKNKMPNSNLKGKEEAVESSNHMPVVLVSTSELSQATTDHSPAAANHFSLPPSPVVVLSNEDSSTEKCDTQTTNGTSPPPSPRTTRSRKRKREEIISRKSVKCTVIHDSEVDIPLDMGVLSGSPPHQAESTRADTPNQDLVTSSQSTPPPKKNKVNVATQCDPDEIIVLSDSE